MAEWKDAIRRAQPLFKRACVHTGSIPVLTTMKNETNDWKQGLSNGHIAQIVRRKNVVRVVESKKVYNRKKMKNNFGN